MVQDVIDLASINSGTANQAGVAQVAAWAVDALDRLGAAVTREALPDREMVSDAGEVVTQAMTEMVIGRMRPEAERQVVLCIHLDTVYGLEHPFQTVRWLDEEKTKLNGPGVADAKGGLVVMLAALDAFEALPEVIKSKVGWTVLLNPDEEVGSMSSVGVLHRWAGVGDWGLVYEPTLPDGGLITQRKGSGNFDVVVRGKAAHAGRDFESGRNAVAALSRLFAKLDALTDLEAGTTVNLGRVIGGGPVNIVADLTVGRFNVRVVSTDAMEKVKRAIDALVAEANEAEGIEVMLSGGFTSPPKLMDESTERLLGQIMEVGRGMDLELPTRVSGGVCDGNKLAAAGLPTIDTMGPRGGAIHSSDEYLLVDSLVERAALTAKLLLRFAENPEEFPRSLNRGMS